MLGVVQRLTQSNLIPQRMERRKLEPGLTLERQAEAKLQRSDRALEGRVAERAKELARANQELLREAKRCKDVEGRFNTISESVPSGAWILLDNERRVLDANEAAFELFGFTVEELQKLRWDSLIPPEKLADVATPVQPAKRRGRAGGWNYRNARTRAAVGRKHRISSTETGHQNQSHISTNGGKPWEHLGCWSLTITKS